MAGETADRPTTALRAGRTSVEPLWSNGEGWVGKADDYVCAPLGADGGREWLGPYVGARVWRVHHDRLATLGPYVDADVAHVLGATAEEDEVARFERRAWLQLRPGVVLVLGDPGQRDPGSSVGGLGEPRAVEADAGGLAAPDVWSADLGERPVDGDPAGGAGRDGLSLGLTIMPTSA